MNELKIFESSTFGSVRIIEDAASNQLLFMANDVCNALGYTNGRDAVSKHVDKWDVAKRDTPIPNQHGTPVIQQTTYVTESGLYSLIFGSKQKRAKEFKRWVTSEVLPAIRRDGGYMAVREDESEEDLMARALVVAKNTLKRREERIKQLENDKEQKQRQIETQSAQISELSHAVEEMQPKVSYLELIMQDKGRTLTVTEIAQDYGISAKAFNKILEGYRVQRRVNGVWIVYAPYLKEGYVVSRTKRGKYPHSDGTPFFYQQTEWTYKGRAFLYEQLKKKGIVPTIEKQE